MISDTSLEAYENLNLTAKENEVLTALLSAGKPCTSLMLEVHCFLIGSSLRRNTITGRFNSLEDKKVLTTKVGKCEISGNSAKFYYVKG